MLRKIALSVLLSLFFSPNLSCLDYIKDKIFRASKVDLFSTPDDYADCIRQFIQTPPVLTAQNIQEYSLDQLIPAYHYQLVNPTNLIGKEIDFLSGDKKVRCSVDFFSLMHHHLAFECPIQLGGLYLLGCILPNVFLTPVLTTTLIAGTGYVGYRLWEKGFLQEFLTSDTLKKNNASQEEKPSKLSILMSSFGIGNRFSDIIGSQLLTPQYSANGQHIIYEGQLSDGVIPGKKIRYKIVLKLQGYIS